MTRLVYFETYQYINNAIAREKELKHWTRAQKVALIESTNPTWEELMPDEPDTASATTSSRACKSSAWISHCSGQKAACLTHGRSWVRDILLNYAGCQYLRDARWWKKAPLNGSARWSHAC